MLTHFLVFGLFPLALCTPGSEFTVKVLLGIIQTDATAPITSGRVNRRHLSTLYMTLLTHMLSVYCGFSGSLIAYCPVGSSTKLSSQVWKFLNSSECPSFGFSTKQLGFFTYSLSNPLIALDPQRLGALKPTQHNK